MHGQPQQRSANTPTLGGGRYLVVKKLGEGGMATVYLAFDIPKRKWCAIKLLHPRYTANEKARKRFQVEAEAMLRMDHPNVVRVLDVKLDGDTPYMVMEAALGGCIVDWLDTHGPMPPRMAVQVAVQVCDGAAAAHKAGVIHRDIKPHNVLVDLEGTCKLTDFGIAQLTNEERSLTQTGSVMGTLGFMAPEQKNDAKNVDNRCDVYSIAASLFTLLTARTPTDLFIAEHQNEMLEGVPEAAIPVILKATRYKKEDRHLNVDALLADFEQLFEQLPEDPADAPSLILHHEALPQQPTAEMWNNATLAAELRSTAQKGPGRAAPAPAPVPVMDLGAPRGGFAPPSFGQSTTGGFRPPASAFPAPPASGAYPNPRRSGAIQNPRTTRTNNELPSYLDAGDLDDHALAAQTGRSPARTVEPDPSPGPNTTMDADPPKPAKRSNRAAQTAAIAFPVAAAAGIGVLIVFAVLFAFIGAWWGVSSAESKALVAQQELFVSLEDERTVIDELAVIGGDVRELESLYFTFHDARGDSRPQAAVAYARALNQQGQFSMDQVHPSRRQTASRARKRITEIDRARTRFEAAHERWEDRSSGLFGTVAVTIGLANEPTSQLD